LDVDMHGLRAIVTTERRHCSANERTVPIPDTAVYSYSVFRHGSSIVLWRNNKWLAAGVQGDYRLVHIQRIKGIVRLEQQLAH
jgi:hypothetical protein